MNYEDDLGRCEGCGHLVREDLMILVENGGEEFLLCQECLDDELNTAKPVVR